MEIQFTTLFLLKLTPEELSIVRKALLGKLTEPEQIEKAKEINGKILDQLSANLKAQLNNIEGAKRE